jgi:hypothetical protein
MHKRKVYTSKIKQERPETFSESMPQCITGAVILSDLVGTDHLKHIDFNDCTFRCPSLKSFRFSHCNFTDCIFIGNPDFTYDQNDLTFDSYGSLKNIRFTGGFTDITISALSIINLKDDSKCYSYSIKHCRMHNSEIFGSTSMLSLNDLRFTGRPKEINTYKDVKPYLVQKIQSLLFKKHPHFWDKEVTTEAHVSKTSFDDSWVNPYFFTIKCREKDTIDYTNARFIDNWSMLRKQYSGLSLIIVLLLTLVFFFPLIVKYFILISATNVGGLDSMQLTTTPFWRVLLFNGEETWLKWVYCSFTIMLITYNTLRLYVTLQVAKLREEEKFVQESNYSISALSPNKYKTEVKIHKTLRVLLLFTSIYALYKFIEALGTMVYDLNGL